MFNRITSFSVFFSKVVQSYCINDHFVIALSFRRTKLYTRISNAGSSDYR